MNSVMRFVGLLTIVLSSVSHEAQAMSALLSAAASVAPTAARYLNRSTTVRDDKTAHLDSLLEIGDYSSLSADLRNVLQDDRSPLGMDYRDWVECKQFNEIPLIEYIAFRDGVNTVRKAGLDKVETLLMLMYQFCLHYHIDAMTCIKAAVEENHRRATTRPLSLLTAMREDFKQRHIGIMRRVNEKFSTITHQACPGGLLHERLQHPAIYQRVAAIKAAPAAHAATAKTAEDYTLDRHQLKAAAWVFNVQRDSSYIQSFVGMVRDYVGSSVLGNPTGGVIFGNADKDQRSTLADVTPIMLQGWYSELRASLLVYLEKNVSDWDGFFKEDLWSNWLEQEVDRLKSCDAAQTGPGGLAGAGRGGGGGPRSRHASSAGSESYSSGSGSAGVMGSPDGGGSAGADGFGGASGALDPAMPKVVAQLLLDSAAGAAGSRLTGPGMMAMSGGAMGAPDGGGSGAPYPAVANLTKQLSEASLDASASAGAGGPLTDAGAGASGSPLAAPSMMAMGGEPAAHTAGSVPTPPDSDDELISAPTVLPLSSSATAALHAAKAPPKEDHDGKHPEHDGDDDGDPDEAGDAVSHTNTVVAGASHSPTHNEVSAEGLADDGTVAEADSVAGGPKGGRTGKKKKTKKQKT